MRINHRARSRRTSLPRLAALVLVAAITLPAPRLRAQAAASVFDSKGFQANREYQGLLSFEHVDTFSGNLLLDFTDLTLPGNGGFALEFERSVNVRDATVSWSFGLRGVPMRISNPDGPVLGSTNPEASFPRFETADGASRTAFPDVGLFGDYWTSHDHWVYRMAERKVELPNGVLCYYDAHGYLTSVHAPVGVPTAPHVPIAQISWTAPGQGTPPPLRALTRVRQFVGHTASGAEAIRVVDFTPAANGHLPAEMRVTRNNGTPLDGVTRVWTYEYLGASSALIAVTPPAGPGWTFEYGPTYPSSLSAVVTPWGGRIEYQYASKPFRITEALVETHVVLSARTVPALAGLAAGTWNYDYVALLTNGAQTTVTSPCGDQTVYLYSATVDDSFLQKRTLKHASTGQRLEVESLTYLTGGGPNFARRSPISERKIERFVDDVISGTYLTTYHYDGNAPFLDYGRAYQIVETGELTRTTNRTFRYTFGGGLYLLDRIASQSVTEGLKTYTTSSTYDMMGFKESETVNGLTTTYVPEAGTGNVRTATDGDGHVTAFTYEWGAVKSTTVGLAGAAPIKEVSRTIHEIGTMASETRRGHTTSFVYDALGRPINVTPPLGLPATAQYPTAPPRVEVTRDNRVTTRVLDGFGRTIEQQDSAPGVATVYRRSAFNACGEATDEGLPFFAGGTERKTTRAYDPLGRLLSETHPDGEQNLWAYLAGGVTRITDEDGRHTEQTWRAFGDPDAGRLTQVKSAVGTPAMTIFDYEYTALGQLKKVTMPGGGVRTWIYDDTTGLLAFETHPESGTTSYTYRPDGQLHKRIRGTQEFTHIYDAAHQLIGVNGPGTAHDLTFAYDSAGNRTLSQNGHVTTTFEWDAANRLFLRHDTIADVDGPGPFVQLPTVSTRWDYDGRDRVTKLTYPSGTVVKYGYDALDRLTTVKRVEQGADVEVWTRLASYASGAVAQSRLGNGIEETFTFDDRLRPLLIAGGALGLTYAYTPSGNVSSIADSSGQGQNQTFGYDALDRLTTVTGWGAQSFTYDALGNRLTVGGQAYHYDGSTLRLSHITGPQPDAFTYDPFGNLASAAGIPAITYTPRDQMETVTVGTTTTAYRYDADQRRVARVGAKAEYFVHDPGGRLLTEGEDPGGAPRVTRDYVYAGDRLVASLRPAAATASVALTSASQTVSESAGLVTATVALTLTQGIIQTAVTVPWSLVASTAAAGSDFTAASGTVTFPAGSASGAKQTIDATLLGDALDEEDAEAFAIVLGSPTGATLNLPNAQTVNLQDDDGVPAVSIGDAPAVLEGANGTTSAVFTLTLSAVSGRAVTVAYSTTGHDSAVGGGDYASAATTLTIPAGKTTGTGVISVLGDPHVEHTETFLVTLANPVHATIGDGSGIGTILNDDSFADDPLMPFSTPIRAVHLAELRAQIDFLRAARGMSAYAWTGAPPAAGMVPILAHITEPRAALAEVYLHAGKSPPVYTDPALAAGTTIRMVHVEEIRHWIKVAPQ